MDIQPKSRKVSSRVIEGILAAIERKEFRAGQWLPPERELMQRFGVGRPAVREAIAGLATRGVLLTRPGYRPVIQESGYDTAVLALSNLLAHMIGNETGVSNLFDLRVFVEAALVRHAAKLAQPKDIEDLRKALEANRAAIEDPEAFYKTDVAFHNILYCVPGNPILPAIHKAYVDWLSSHWTKMPRSFEINRMNFAAHESIFQAIFHRDADQAEQMLRSHLVTAWQFVCATFQIHRKSVLPLARLRNLQQQAGASCHKCQPMAFDLHAEVRT